jgi:hypothetical protein
MKQIFFMEFEKEEVIEIGQIAVPLMKALHLKAIEVQRVCPTPRAVGYTLRHCPTIIIRDGVHCSNCGKRTATNPRAVA